jgi:hypothetical protein
VWGGGNGDILCSTDVRSRRNTIKRFEREDLGRYREIEEDARILHRDMEEIRDPEQMRGRFGEINGKYIEIRKKIQENPWEIREDSEQGVHRRYKEIQYGMFTGETGRSVGNAECYGERWGDSARTQGNPGRRQGDSGEI